MPAEAYKHGLEVDKSIGANPFKFGLAGGTDGHTSLAAVQENNFFGKHSGAEPSPERMMHPFMATEEGAIMGWQQVASGLAAVWAKENTREALFDAMERKEVYATTGSRMMVRFFGGWDFTDKDLNNREPAFAGYEKGVPMGGDLPAGKTGKAPSFMVFALRDPIGGNLDRIQIIKGWYDGKQQHEKVYDVAWSGDRQPGKDGKVPAVGNTVDAKTASWTNTIGASELGGVWTDPDFDPQQKAFYYARVLEIPTRAGPPMTPSASVCRSPRARRSRPRTGPTPPRSGTRRSRSALARRRLDSDEKGPDDLGPVQLVAGRPENSREIEYRMGNGVAAAGDGYQADRHLASPGPVGTGHRSLVAGIPFGPDPLLAVSGVARQPGPVGRMAQLHQGTEQRAHRQQQHSESRIAVPELLQAPFPTRPVHDARLSLNCNWYNSW